MTAIKKKIISAENLREWMNNRLHENEEFKEFTFNTPSKSGTVKLNDSNWGSLKMVFFIAHIIQNLMENFVLLLIMHL